MESQSPTHRASPVEVEPVPCPACGADRPTPIATGPDYDHHCSGDQRFTLAECGACGFTYLNPRPTTAMLPVIYNAENYVCYGYTQNRPRLAEASRRYEDERAAEIFRTASRPAADYRVLDIGAGEGRSLLSFQQLGVPAGNLCAVDISDEILAPLQAQGLQTVRSRAEDLELPENSFDLVMLNQVIEHVADPRRVMQNAHRMLKPGGLLLMETPNLDGWDRRFFFRRGLWGGYHFPRHWVLFSTATMTRMLRETGFPQPRIVDISAAFVWSWNLGHLFQSWKLPARFAREFAPHNYAAMVLGGLIDLLPRKLWRSSNMRALATKP